MMNRKPLGDFMTRPIAALSFLCAWLTLAGCANDDDKTVTYPARPTQEMLDNGPETGKQFLKWNSTGISRGAPMNYTVSGYCYPGLEADIEIQDMIGLSVSPEDNPSDTIYCTLTVEDTGFTLADYAPDGLDWADSVTYWVDTTCVTIPEESTPTDIVFYYYRPSDGSFNEVATRMGANGRHWVAKTTHFSRYILGQKRRIS
jgi:hypothetical protein